MYDETRLRDLAPQCQCLPGCLDVASGVLMHRHGLTYDEARGALLRSAERQNESVHVIAQNVIASATTDTPPDHQARHHSCGDYTAGTSHA